MNCSANVPGPSKKSRVGIGEKEKSVVLECYNTLNSKGWKEVVLTARQKIGEIAASMPQHIVNLYLTQTDESLTRRMQNIIKSAMQQPYAPESGEIGTEKQLLVSNQTRYSRKMQPDERRAEALKVKLDQNFADSSPSEDESIEPSAKKKRKLDTAKEANLAHAKMCEKAMSTMENVNQLLLKVDKYISDQNGTKP